jgi:hypothetical protein
VFLLLAAVLDLANDASSFVTDVPQTAVRLALIALWYRALIAPARPALAETYDLISLVLLAATSVSIKMNAAVFAAAAVAAASVAFLRRGQGGGGRRRALAWSSAIALAFGLAWSGRGVVLSGYPLLPSRVFAAPVSWRVPAEHAQAEFDYVVHSSRVTIENVPYIAGRVKGLGVWLPNGITRLRRRRVYYVPAPLLLTLATLPLLLAAWRRATVGERAAIRPAWWILPPTAVALAAWFAVAPDTRYVAPIAWSFVALAGAQAFALGVVRLRPSLRRLLLSAVAVIGVSPLAVNPLMEWRQAREGSPIRAIIRANLRLPPPGSWFEARAGSPVIHPFTTRSGLILQVPGQRCWDGQLPCTPTPDPNLRLRVPGQLDGGFIVDGPWAMQNWPQKWRPNFLPAGGEDYQRQRRGRDPVPASEPFDRLPRSGGRQEQEDRCEKEGQSVRKGILMCGRGAQGHDEWSGKNQRHDTLRAPQKPKAANGQQGIEGSQKRIAKPGHAEHVMQPAPGPQQAPRGPRWPRCEPAAPEFVHVGHDLR